MAHDTQSAADVAFKRRPPSHPRFQVPVNLDDRIAQLTLGNIASLFPTDPPKQRASLSSGFSGLENIWLHALKPAFPGLSVKFVETAKQSVGFQVPKAVEGGYAVAHALEHLRRLRNRVSHQEQILYVDHAARLHDLNALMHAMAPSSLGTVKQLDRIRRTLAQRPAW